ncbi:hypothetical protein [Acinetobacter rudis]|uniref:Uncharacterized protein n=1 Tax=Acinetobacter rudis TaxID=632955 RepID=A0AAW8JB13_9GAMM|nr:hypothetical protein [Acinetobacter rudis]MDQ8937272.1 hypothetical protein [Acinetobacter rudis]MDQ9019476.1 hypothetical protein [Acinetobacter rudis]
MYKIRFTYIQEQGKNIIIIPMEQNFEYKNKHQQLDILKSLELLISNSEFIGTVVLVWLSGDKMKYIAPLSWHPFFNSLTWNYVIKNLNRQLAVESINFFS